MIIIIGATMAAFFIKGLCGFANTLVFESILGFTMSNIIISPVELLVSFPANGILAWNKRKSSSIKVWAPITILVVIGMIPGVLVLKNLNVDIVKVIFGFTVIGITIEMFIREFVKIEKASPKIFTAMIGIVAGLMTGMFGIGALVAPYIAKKTDIKDSFQANISIVFFLGNILRILLYALSGIFTKSILLLSLKLLPFMGLALFLGMKFSNHLSDILVKKIVLLFLFLSGVSLIVMNLL